jgi:glycosyltransferase involved in cell wall biosynthesis
LAFSHALEVGEGKTTLSIIICTKDRQTDLRNCLGSVVPSHSRWSYDELIVVDSSENPSSRAETQHYSRQFGAQYIYEKRKGLSIARNTGIQESHGEIVVFLDDDFIIDEDAIKNLTEGYADLEVACCTGRMLSHQNDDISMLFERYFSFDRGPTRLEVTSRDMSFTKLFKIALSRFAPGHFGRMTAAPYSVGFGFCSFRREVFRAVGLFDTRLGRGTRQMGADDVDMYYRILRGGRKIVYEPRAIIFHNHRHDSAELVRYAYSSGISVASFTRKHLKKDPYVLALWLANLLLTFSRFVTETNGARSMLKSLAFGQLKGTLPSSLNRS